MIYKHHYQILKEELKQVYRLGITFDFWSNRKGESFLCITGLWFTNNIDCVSKVIDFSTFNHHHTAKDIARVVKEKLVALDIYEKIICITCDGAQNMVLACSYLSPDIPRVWCCGHRLHLVVINSLGFWLIDNKIDNYINNLSMATATTAAKTASTTATTTSATANSDYEDQSLVVDWDPESDEGNSFHLISAYVHA